MAGKAPAPKEKKKPTKKGDKFGGKQAAPFGSKDEKTEKK